MMPDYFIPVFALCVGLVIGAVWGICVSFGIAIHWVSWAREWFRARV